MQRPWDEGARSAGMTGVKPLCQGLSGKARVLQGQPSEPTDPTYC